MEPRRDAERFRPSLIDIWIGNIILNGVEGVIFTLIFLAVNIFWETAHTGSAMFVNTQLILVFLIGFQETLNIFIQSKTEHRKSFRASSVIEIRNYYTGYHSLLSQSSCSDGGHLHGS